MSSKSVSPAASAHPALSALVGSPPASFYWFKPSSPGCIAFTAASTNNIPNSLPTQNTSPSWPFGVCQRIPAVDHNGHPLPYQVRLISLLLE
ncbi:MAG: hypothetical protein P8Z00_19475 [Anaerolineales bacterium]